MIKTALFFKSSGSIADCPQDGLPEFAFIGRSNVGKSSLINMLCSNRSLARISSNPGKTQCINHYIINKKWYLVDLPGYGYAKVSKDKRAVFSKMVQDYLAKRDTLKSIIALIDSRIPPQNIDLDFLEWCHKKSLPYIVVFTKSDKAGITKCEQNVEMFKSALKENGITMPYMIITSAEKKKGKEELYSFFDFSLKSE